MRTTMLLFAAGALSMLPAAPRLAYTLTPNATFSIFDAFGAQVSYAGFPLTPATAVFTKDGKTVWGVGTFGGDLYGIDVATKTLKYKVNLQASFPKPVLSPDGTRLYVAGGTGIVAVDPSNGTVIGTAPVGFVEFLSVAPDNLHVYATTGAAVLIVDAVTLTLAKQFTVSRPFDIAALPDNQTAAVRVITDAPAGTGPIVRLDLTTGATTPLINQVFTYFILSPNGKKIYGLNGSQILLADIATGKSEDVGGVTVTPNSLCASPNQAKLYATTTTGLLAIGLTDNSLLATTAGASPVACAVSPDSSRVWMANSAPNQIGVLDTVAGKLAGVLEAPANALSMALTPDGTRLFVATAPGAGFAGQMAVIDTVSGKTIPQNLNLSPVALGISRDGAKLVVANQVNGTDTLVAVDVASLTVTASVFSPQFNTTDIVFSPDNSRYYMHGYMLNSGSSEIASFDNVTNNFLGAQPTVGVAGLLTISPDGSTLYAADGFGPKGPNAIAVIPTGTLQENNLFQAARPNKGLILSTDGSVVFALGGTAGTGVFQLVGVSTNTGLVTASTTLRGKVNDSQSQMLALSPDGGQIYVSDYRQTWLVTAGSLILEGTLPVASTSPYLFGPH